MAYNNDTKPTGTFTNDDSGIGSLAAWDDAIATWNDASIAWGGIPSLTLDSKPSGSYVLDAKP